MGFDLLMNYSHNIDGTYKHDIKMSSNLTPVGCFWWINFLKQVHLILKQIDPDGMGYKMPMNHSNNIEGTHIQDIKLRSSNGYGFVVIYTITLRLLRFGFLLDEISKASKSN